MKAQAPGTAAAGTSHQEHDLSSLVEPIPVASETAAVVPVASTASTEESELDVRLGRSFIPVTATVDCETKASFLSLLAETAEGEINTRQPICLVGLHACGDLTSSIVRVFIESEMSGVSEGFLNANAVANPALSMSAAFRIKSLVVVGCCYNRMTEWKPANATEDATTTSAMRVSRNAFPLSDYLKGQGPCLGKRLRMLACQSTARMAQESFESHELVYYRTVLQCLLHRHRLLTVSEDDDSFQSEPRVGRIKRVRSFADYALKALSRLKVAEASICNEEYLRQFFEEFRPAYGQFVRFLRLRAGFASCIERLIGLDRLCVLLEASSAQQQAISARLVQVFDPALSPRAFALVASRI
eukprot:m.212690 g.212690  ORF g.212690 m.212690 type:complete len:358 (+) comp54015_c0_seq3:588-1661(+)